MIHKIKIWRFEEVFWLIGEWVGYWFRLLKEPAIVKFDKGMKREQKKDFVFIAYFADMKC